MYIHTYIHIYIDVYIHTCIHIIYTYIYIDIHATRPRCRVSPEAAVRRFKCMLASGFKSVVRIEMDVYICLHICIYIY